jgi:hypothetical protein
MWETPVLGLRAGASIQAMRIDGSVLSPMAPAPVDFKLPAILWVGSAEYVREDLLLALEYSRWHVRVDSSDPAVVPESSTVSERAYALAAYRVRPWLQPGLYYSLLYRDVAQRSGRAAKQHDAALTLRFDINPHWLLKLEAHYMRGTGDVSPQLNNNTPRESLRPSWGLFVAKTTAYF